MENNQERIEELRSQIDDNIKDLKEIYQSAGQRVAVPDVHNGETVEISEALTVLSSLEKKIGKIDSQIEDLSNSYNRISEITDREKEISEEFAILEKENRKLLEPIGKAAYLEWKNNPVEEQNKMMTGLEESDSKIRELDNEIYQLQNNEDQKSLLQKIKVRSRVAILNSRKKSTQSSMVSLYKRIGEKLYKKDITYFKNMNNDSVEVFIENRKKLDELSVEIDALKEESSTIEKHLKSSFSLGKRQKAEDKLQSERDFTVSEKMTALNDLGSLIYSKKMDFGDKELQLLFTSADEIHEKNNTLTLEIEKCTAELEVIELDAEIIDMKSNIKELQLTIEKCNSDIEEFNKEIKRARTEIRKLKKITERSTDESDNEES